MQIYKKNGLPDIPGNPFFYYIISIRLLACLDSSLSSSEACDWNAEWRA